MGSIRVERMAAVAALLALLLTACGQAVAGVAHVGDVGCPPPAADAPRAPSTMLDAPVITVDDRVSFWIPNGHTAPLGLAVYADGTVIRAEGNGSHAEPLTPMTIGSVDGCRVDEAVEALVALADADFGMPGITDQATTTVTVTSPGDPVVLSVYALGIGDDYVDRTEASARATLTATLDAIVGDTTAAEPWAPDRFQLTRFADEVSGPSPRWPLAGPIADRLRQRTYGGLACGVVDGADAAAIAAALGRRPVLSPWGDGRDTVSLAVGVLVPGQPACVG